MSARFFLHALRLRVVALLATVAGLSVAAVTALALLFAPVPSGTARLGARGGVPAEQRAPLALRGAVARTHAVGRELHARGGASPSASAEHPTARASGRGAAQDSGPLPDVAPAEPFFGLSSARSFEDRLDRGLVASPTARTECLRSAIVCSPREARAPPLG